MNRSPFPNLPVVDEIPVEADGVGPDGEPFDVILWVLDGYLAEVEIVEYGRTRVAWPSPDALTLDTKG